MKFIKNKAVMIAIVLAVALLIIGGFFVFLREDLESETDAPIQNSSLIENVSPDELGLSIEANPAGNEIRFSLEKITGIESLEYQIQYEADSTAREIGEGAEPRVDRGIIGEVEIDPSDSEYKSDWIVLGSESAGTKRYDTGVEEVILTLKINNSDGSVLQTEDSLKLE